MMARNIDYAFSVWAFGDVWDEFLLEEKQVMDLFEAWNYRHGDLLLLDKHDSIGSSLHKMKQLWSEHGNKSEA